MIFPGHMGKGKQPGVCIYKICPALPARMVVRVINSVTHHAHRGSKRPSTWKAHAIITGQECLEYATCPDAAVAQRLALEPLECEGVL